MKLLSLTAAIMLAVSSLGIGGCDRDEGAAEDIDIGKSNQNMDMDTAIEEAGKALEEPGHQ